MNNSNLLLFTLACIVIVSCNKDLSLYEESRQYCRDNIQFSCVAAQGERYFSGKINGTAFCVSEGVDDYWVLNSVVTETFTSTENPVFIPGTPPSSTWYSFSLFPPIMDHLNGLPEEFMPSVIIQTPAFQDTVAHKPSEYFERFIRKGDLPIKRQTTDRYAGFDLSIGWRCVFLPGYRHYKYGQHPDKIPSVSIGFAASLGTQSDATFRIAEYEKIVTPKNVIYNLTFEIECNLYSTAEEDDYRFYGRLTEGVFKTQVILEPDE